MIAEVSQECLVSTSGSVSHLFLYGYLIRSCALSLGQGFCLRVSYELEHELTCRLASVMLAPPCTGGTVDSVGSYRSGRVSPDGAAESSGLFRRPPSPLVAHYHSNIREDVPVGLGLSRVWALSAAECQDKIGACFEA